MLKAKTNTETKVGNPLLERALKVTPDKLSPLQREIVQLIAESHSTRSIARLVKRSLHGVEYHYKQIENKLRLDGFNVALITRWALAHRLAHLECT